MGGGKENDYRRSSFPQAVTLELGMTLKQGCFASLCCCPWLSAWQHISQPSGAKWGEAWATRARIHWLCFEKPHEHGVSGACRLVGVSCFFWRFLREAMLEYNQLGSIKKIYMEQCVHFKSHQPAIKSVEYYCRSQIIPVDWQPLAGSSLTF